MSATPSRFEKLTTMLQDQGMRPLPEGMQDVAEKLLASQDYRGFIEQLAELNEISSDINWESIDCRIRMPHSQVGKLYSALSDGDIAAIVKLDAKRKTFEEQKNLVNQAKLDMWKAAGAERLLYLGSYLSMILSEVDGKLCIDASAPSGTKKIPLITFIDNFLHMSRNRSKKSGVSAIKSMKGFAAVRDDCISQALKLFDRAAEINAQNPALFAEVPELLPKVKEVFFEWRKEGIRYRQAIEERKKTEISSRPLLSRIAAKAAHAMTAPHKKEEETIDFNLSDISPYRVRDKWTALHIRVSRPAMGHETAAPAPVA